MIHVLVVESETKLNKDICAFLIEKGCNATGCTNVNDAYEEMHKNIYEFIITDVHMPETDGFEFARKVRAIDEKIPILFLSSKEMLYAEETGFLSGNEDFIVKPIKWDELVVRIRSLLYRAGIDTARKIEVGNLMLDLNNMNAEIDGEQIELTTREFNIIYKLLSNPKKLFSRKQLMDEFWKDDSKTSLRAVDVYITRLRNKFSACSEFKIVTVRGLGYKLILV